MKENLDSLKSAMEAAFDEAGFVVFRAHSRLGDPHEQIHWDYDHFPDFKKFLDAARGVGARMIVFHYREFSPDVLAEAAERLEEAELPRDEKRTLERRMLELQVYEGFTCALEASFDHDGRTYILELHTKWYDELLDILDDIDAALPEDEEDDNGPIGGYFSRN
jgi:hypothetical protein